MKLFDSCANAFCGVVMFLFATAAVGCELGKGSQDCKTLRLDAIESDTYRLEFRGGHILNVPVVLSFGLTQEDLAKPIQSPAFRFSFWYPDMTPAHPKSDMDTIFEKGRNAYVLQKDRFPVRVSMMFYSEGELGNLPWERRMEMPFLYARPPRQFANIAQQFDGKPPLKFKLMPTNYAGLLEAVRVMSKDEEQEAVDYKKRIIESDKKWKIQRNWNAKTTIYVAPNSSSYELLMRCDIPEGMTCDAEVYSKTNHFQYRLKFPVEALEHTDEMIRSLDRMTEVWARNKLPH